jgi:hypothetical protein
MNIQFLTSLPSWWIIICLLLGLAYSFILYRHDHLFESVHKWLKKFLFTVRTTAVFILAVLLLTPLIRTFTREKEKPVVVIAQDNSSSIILNKDSAFYKNPDGYKKNVDKLINDLKDKFEVHTISWGDRISDRLEYSFDEKQTDFTSLQKQLGVRFGNRNIGAVIIASDGLYNRGSSPLYDDELKVPVYTIALGDTTIQKDVLISRLNYNRTVYFGNTFPVEVTVAARQCSGEKTILTVQQDTTVLFSRSLAISGNRFSQLVPVLLDAKKTGLAHYKIKVSSIQGEMTIVNNESDIYVDVIETKQKILVIGNAPHPDLGAIKEGIESSENYSVKIVLADQAEQLGDYNLIILHNLPSNQHPVINLIEQIKKTSTPVLYIVGSQTSLQQFNSLNAGLSISGDNAQSTQVQAAINPDFSRFTISDEMRRVLPLFPPLTAPYGNYNQTTDNSIFLNHQIGAVTTTEPLQLFNENGNSRTGIICGEGIWRWRLSDYSINGTFNVFHDWLLKTVQNLAVKEKNSHFRLISKNSFAENEAITFDAEVYNDNYELINIPDVNITLVNSSNKSFPYTFSKNEKGYTLNAGFLPAGQYKYKASVNVGGKLYTNTGELSVTALQAEQIETVADHQLMYALAQKSGGEMFYPNQLSDLAKKLLARTDIKTITYSHYKLRDLVDWKLIFFLIMGLLSIEWFLRKRAGEY